MYFLELQARMFGVALELLVGLPGLLLDVSRKTRISFSESLSGAGGHELRKWSGLVFPLANSLSACSAKCVRTP
jgi:hypothetical protein